MRVKRLLSLAMVLLFTLMVSVSVYADGGSSDPVAEVGGKEYVYLEDAIANSNGQTVTLLADVSQNQIISDNMTVELDLNDWTLEGSIQIQSGGALTITGDGTITYTGGDTITNSGTLIIEKGTIQNENTSAYCAIRSDSGSVTIEGGMVQGNIAVQLAGGSDLCLRGGRLDGHEKDIDWINGNISITGGEFHFDTSVYVDPSIYDVIFVADDFYTVRAILANYTVTIADDIEHGTVTADKNTAPADDIVTLTVTPDAGYALDTLTVSYFDENDAVQTLPLTQGLDDDADKWTFTMPAANVTVSATWVGKPAFALQNLALGEQIGVRFWMDLSTLSEAEKASSKMTFTIRGEGGGTREVPYGSKDGTEEYEGKDYDVFRCTLNSVQMADTITATFAYTQDGAGAEQSISTTYSILAYINGYDAYIADHPNQYPPEMTALIHALANYGHYAQPFLAGTWGWKIGEEATGHKEMPLRYEAADEENAESQTDYPFVKENDDVSVSYALYLDSKTALRAFFIPKEGYTGGITKVTVDGQDGSYTVTSTTSVTEAGWYMVEIRGIGPRDLATAHTVTVTTASGTATITFSALSYAHAMIDQNMHADRGGPEAMAALYEYYAATDAYLTYLDNKN